MPSTFTIVVTSLWLMPSSQFSLLFALQNELSALLDSNSMHQRALCVGHQLEGSKDNDVRPKL